MATTTNYGWTTPDDTALVKDGASAIRTLGSSVDTTTKALNPSTTLGDIEYRSSTANTNTRLGIGSAGQVLTVAAGVPSWATSSSGGMTLLSTTNLSGTTTTVSSISQDYVNLFIVVQDPFLNSAATLRLKPNGGNTGHHIAITGGSTFTDTSNIMDSQANLATSTFPTYVNFVAQINNYTNTTYGKTYSFFGATASGTSGIARFGNIQTASAITSLEVSTGGGTSTFSGGRVLIYGVK